MSNEFEIKTIADKHGQSVTVRQLEGITYDPMYGYTSGVQAVVLTPFEAEKLAEEILKAARTARANLNKSKYNIP